MHKAINITGTVLESLKKHDIFKDVLLSTGVDTFKPAGTLAIEYPVPDVTVAMGNKLTTGTTQEKPKVFYAADQAHPLDLTASYTLVMTDPDAPSRTDHKWSEYCHYVETGVKFKDPSGGFVEGGHILQPYLGPGPPEGTGFHRYVWLLYQEPGAGPKQLSAIGDRPNWGFGQPGVGVDKWANLNSLKLLAVNFFFAEHE
ncbi:YbhB/YbcL family Raf kinase inhibitor-like protein KNAG_0C00620 [Huiozyma naganishii CBS 8797]|uniref:Phosphatidylethanolamine-binding protein n=1 Tax=Huiozyma naganishii (strain ATCC MYA-139 / BCRC 22969 / CBS 8797 / KCTC 17520 / NBRC 10181 / NCYC 3082 / Yp74L-3) TaxID=1071383 RepID=J7S5I8_HUIN7|nr:hypothetical protein KNAG_0C00620 [Kazachstania naganishii CBS 8797]CCK69176.1 hypothetical protein KNAG_0C00620 [Kazachstania naganishii CBS 8797]